ncbi:MAG: hypothetical protein LBK12_02210 [Odoribacteraceae bacterium]|jgi:hypothetical protein|nr:hypothetical protein [Odoribacteraceae bacterium]
MKHAKMMKYLLLTMLSVSLWSCDKKDDPFSGGDNYIVAFSLTSGGQTISASISDAEIILEKPAGYSLNGATATLTLSENARVLPNPADISDWENEQLFVVTSRDGQKREYTYSVTGGGNEIAGSVVLLTQEEVDAFGEGGATAIAGSLVIGAATGRDSITSLTPLNALKKVGYNVIFKATYAGRALEGLNALETIGGTLRVETSGLKEIRLAALEEVLHVDVASKSLARLECPRLMRVRGDLAFATTDLSAIDMPTLEEVERNLSLDIPDFRNDASSMQALAFPALKRVGGTFSIANLANISKIELQELVSCGAISLTSSASLSTLTLSLPKLETCENALLFDNLAMLQEVTLPSLERVESFTITSCGNLETVDLPKLKEVEKDLDICPFIDMSADGYKKLAALTTVGGVFHVRYGYETRLQTMILPPALKSCQSLQLNDCPTLEKIDVTGINIGELLAEKGSLINLTIKGGKTFNGLLNINAYENSSVAATTTYTYAFPKLEGIEEIGDLYFVPGSRMDDHLTVSNFKKVNRNFTVHSSYASVKTLLVPDLTEVTGNLIVSALNGFTRLEFTSIQKVDGDIIMGTNSYSALFGCETIAFPALVQAGGDVLVYVPNSYITSILMPELATIDGTLRIMYPVDTRYNQTNTTLTNLDGFAKLTSVGEVNIERMMALTSFEGLKNCVANLTDARWQVSDNKYNPTLEDMKSGNWNQ